MTSLGVDTVFQYGGRGMSLVAALDSPAVPLVKPMHAQVPCQQGMTGRVKGRGQVLPTSSRLELGVRHFASADTAEDYSSDSVSEQYSKHYTHAHSLALSHSRSLHAQLHTAYT